MTDRKRTNTPAPFQTEVQRVEAQCDERHQVYSTQLNKANGRLQQLFGDSDTKTPGLLHSIQKGQEDLSIGLSEVKKKVQGLEVKLAIITSVIMVIVQVVYHYVSKAS